MSPISIPQQRIDPAKIEESIQLLNRFTDDADIEPLISVLQSLGQAPADEALLDRLRHSFDKLGVKAGLVLTYAPYVGIVLVDDSFLGPEQTEDDSGKYL